MINMSPCMSAMINRNWARKREREGDGGRVVKRLDMRKERDVLHILKRWPIKILNKVINEPLQRQQNSLNKNFKHFLLSRKLNDVFVVWLSLLVQHSHQLQFLGFLRTCIQLDSNATGQSGEQ